MATDQERIDAFWRIANAANEMSAGAGKNMQIQELTERVNLCNNGFSITAPYASDETGLQCHPIWVASQNVGPNDLKICPFFEEDFLQYEVVRGMFPHKSSYAMYNRPLHNIFLNMGAEETFRAHALFFIHELGHAKISVRNGMALTQRESPLDERIEEEVMMWSFDYKFLLAFGGPAYRQEFERGIYRVRKLRRRQMRDPNIQVSVVPGCGSALDICLEKPPTPQAAETRDLVFQLYCEFAAADQNLPPLVAWQFKCQLAKKSVMTAL